MTQVGTTNLIEPRLLQKLQDCFCKANGVYLACIDKREGVITKAYGFRWEKEFIYSIINQDTYMSLLSKMENCEVENVIEEDMEADYVKMAGISVMHGDSDHLIWIVTAFISEKLPEDFRMPEDMITTSEEKFYASIEFLEALTRQLVEVRLDANDAERLMLSTQKSEDLLTQQLHRMEALNEIVTLLEAESGFSSIVDSALKNTCDTINVSAGCLMRQNSDGIHIDIISLYQREGQELFTGQTGQIPKEEIPFFNGKPYLISSDSIRPDSFRKYMEANHISAAIFQPVEVKERLLMYLCFFIIDQERIWSMEDIRFINDVKRVIQSVLAKRIAKNSLASSYNSLEAILEHVGCGIYVADIQGRNILYMNKQFKELFRRTIENGKLDTLIFEENERQHHASYEEIFSAEESRWIDAYKTTINWVDGKEVRLCTVYDITDKKKYQQKIESQANNDFLTGLYNRMRCEQDLERIIRRNSINNREGALLYIDLDDFKHINDGLGHQYGDVLLKAISHSLTRIPGLKDNCYRMGGDEFVVIIEDTSRTDVEDVCKAVRDIFTNPWFLKGEDYYCTTSIGVAYFPQEGENVDELIKKADMALFSAKRRGRNCIEFYNSKQENSSSKRLELEKSMRSATKNECREFKVYYQPIVDVTEEGNPCCGAEALVRWDSQALGFIKPDDFIPLAEYLGLINPIGEHVLYQAAKRCKYWNDMGHPNYKVNVNLSVVQLLQNDIVKKIKEIIRETRINPKNLRLEVTESLAINDMTRMKRILNEIKALGIGVALDDFGTGYSSLNHIKEMPIDVIKIDKCFIEHLGEDDFSDAFVKMVSQLARSIGVTVCVEGVETQAQYEKIKDMGVRIVQGYYFDKPLSLENFEMKYL